MPILAAAQRVQFFASQPNIDSFPVVRIGVSVTDSLRPVTTLSASNFRVLEDGISPSNVELIGCAGGQSAAIAFVLDTSLSMRASIANSTGGYPAFNDAVAELLNLIPAPSQLVLIPFSDTASYFYPGPAKGYFHAGVAQDSNQFMSSVRAFAFSGSGTQVDYGLEYAIWLLRKSALARRAIILVTDDALGYPDSILSDMNAAGISLFVMQVGAADSLPIQNNLQVALATHGAYVNASDTGHFANAMGRIANQIMGENCTLRYISFAPCPWKKTHSVSVVLSYKGNTYPSLGTYPLGTDRNDTISPSVLQDTSRFTSRLVIASDGYPCQIGLRSLVDSALQNFRIVARRTGGMDTLIDSLVVIDSLQPATGYYVATDSLGNRTRIRVTYSPQPDTHTPVIAQPVLTSTQYEAAITEHLPWDRGIMGVSLATGSINLKLDSVVFANRTTASAYVSVIIAKDSASGCLVAIDSVGNQGKQCILWFGQDHDNYPPLFQQDPLAEPRLTLQGAVTEQRTRDVGLKSVVLVPITNANSPAVTFASAQLARVLVAMDSMYSSRTLVVAFDSVGNSVTDSLRYDPVADTTPPHASISLVTSGLVRATGTEVAPWDRGIRNVSVLLAQNMTPGVAVFQDRRHAYVNLTTVDLTQAGFTSVEFVDSAFNRDTLIVRYDPAAKPILPLVVESPIDFGTIPAPVSKQRSVTIRNPNSFPVTATVIANSGDDSMFTVSAGAPLSLAAGESQDFVVTFAPTLVGSWHARVQLANDTMTLGTIDILGKSTGVVVLSLDTVFVPTPGTQGTLHLRLSSTPHTINLDTLRFSLLYDQDVVTLLDAKPECDLSDSNICNYTLHWEGISNGNRPLTVARLNRGRSPSLSTAASVIDLPFMTAVARHDSSAVAIQPLQGDSLITVTSTPGLVVVGDTCGTKTLRAAMNDQLAATIESIVPNPADDDVVVVLRVAIPGSTCTLRLFSPLGVEEQATSTLTEATTIEMRLNVHALRNGVYFLMLQSGTALPITRRLDIIH